MRYNKCKYYHSIFTTTYAYKLGGQQPRLLARTPMSVSAFHYCIAPVQLFAWKEWPSK